jgi:hypothetical protein
MPVQFSTGPSPILPRDLLVTVARNPNAVRQALAKEKPSGV